MFNPLVSIIIPVYNGKNYLREAIESALAQTYQNIEIIVVNDGSRDEGATEQIAKSFGDAIRYYSKENGGVSTALNLALSVMKGEYFSWLSHDDLYYPNKIESQIDSLRSHEDKSTIVFSNYNFLNMATGKVTRMLNSYSYPTNQLTNSVFPVLQGLIHGCSLLIHRSHFERVGYFEEKLITTQDYDLWFKMLRFNNSIYINDPLVIGRLHDTQSSRTISCHQPEREQLYLCIMKSLSLEEIVSMYGGKYNFYYRMMIFLKNEKLQEAYEYAKQQFYETAVPEDIPIQLLSFRDYLKKISKGRTIQICIFGAGEHGRRLYRELRSKRIDVHFFSDNNPDKWGGLVEQTKCISPAQLEREKSRTLVIAANLDPTDIINQLKSMGFPYLVSKQELDRAMFEISPLRELVE